MLPRIGIDLGPDVRIEHGIEVAVRHGVPFLDAKVDREPNAMEDLQGDRASAIRASCERHGISIGLHTSSAVNMAETAPFLRDAVDDYLEAQLETCLRLGGRWLIVHAGYHFSEDIELRRAAALDRLKRLSERAERAGLTLLLENMNCEPDHAEVNYFAHDLEETRFFFDSLRSPALRWAFTANHAHLVPEGVEGFLEGLDVSRCDEVRLADCWRNGHEVHLRPGEGDFDFASLFAGLAARGYAGRFMTAFGTLDDMIEGRRRLADHGGAQRQAVADLARPVANGDVAVAGTGGRPSC